MNDDDTPLASIKSLLFKHVDPVGFCVGTGSGTLGRWAFYPIEAASVSLQRGQAKTVKEALSQNFDRRNIRASYKGGASLVKSAILASGAYYGLGFAVMNQHKNESIFVQSAWGLVTVLPEQISVVEATKTFRKRNDLSSSNISRKGWARINAGFFLRHLYGNPATFAAVKTTEKLFEKVVPENYHPVSSFFAGAAGVWLTHCAGYSFLVSVSVQHMMDPELSFKDAWIKAWNEKFMKAGHIRAAGRMGTAAVAFGVSKVCEVYFSKDKTKTSEPAASVSRASFFSNADVKKEVVTNIDQNRSHSSRKN